MSEDKANIQKSPWTIRGGEPVDYPGCWVVTGTDMSSGGSWSVFRKEDGSYWEVTCEHFFPPTGGTLHVELGNEITDPPKLAQVRGFYLEWLKQRSAKGMSNTVARWEDDWMHFGLPAVPQYVALARLFVNDELRALVQFHGTAQKHFYTVTRFDSGASSKVPGEFVTLEDAKAAAFGALGFKSTGRYCDRTGATECFISSDSLEIAFVASHD